METLKEEINWRYNQGVCIVLAEDWQMPGTIVKENVDKMLTMGGSPLAWWECNPLAIHQFLSMASDMKNAQRVDKNHPCYDKGIVMMFYGLPLIYDDSLPEVGACGDIVLHCQDGKVLLEDRL